MSLIQELADRLRSTRDTLPIAEVTGAAARLRTAQGLLAWVMHESSRPDTVPAVSLAASRLDHAAAALRVAQDAIDDYCLAVGLRVDGRPTEIPAPVPAQRGTQSDAQLGDWWSERVAFLTGLPVGSRAAGAAGSGGSGSGGSGSRGPGAAGAADSSSSDLLAECVTAALDRDTKRIHKALTEAGPAVGLGLAAVAPPLLRHLAGELVGHPPRLEDLARVRRAALPILAEVLPSLAGDAAEEIIARVCHAQPQREASQPAHPVDIAAACALLVAGMLRANKLAADDLSKVVDREHEAASEAQLRAQERAKSHRAALRITDNSRRRSAVDELRPAAQ